MKNFRLPPLYIETLPDGRRAFQVEFNEWARGAPYGSVLILHAPTGAGKTRAILDLVDKSPKPFAQGVLVTTPTNALACEIVESFRKGGVQSVERWTSDQFTGRNARQRHVEMTRHAQEAALIVTNPDLLHLFTQHEYLHRRGQWDANKTRLMRFAQENVTLHVFDEYHSYDERLLASILLYVMKGRNLGLKHRYAFLSATPDEALSRALDALGIHPTTIEAKANKDGRGERIKCELDVTITGAPIAESLPTDANGPRTLYIFSSFLAQQRAVLELQRREIPENPNGFVQITGRDTRSDRGQQAYDKAPILLATSKVDQGLNIPNLHRVVMQPGWSDQQFWQRFGRAGRDRDAAVVLHFDGYDDSDLRMMVAGSYEELALRTRDILRSRRPAHQDTLLRFIGAYTAAYRANTPPSDERERAVDPDALPGVSRSAYAIVSRVLHQEPPDDPDLPGNGRNWRELVARGLARLRGTALTVTATYDWRRKHDGTLDPLDEDVSWLLTHTDARPPDYHVTELSARPQDAVLHYDVLGSRVRIPYKGGIEKVEPLKRVAREMREAVVADYDRLEGFWEAVVKWLEMVPPDEIAPVEVEADDPIL